MAFGIAPADGFGRLPTLRRYGISLDLKPLWFSDNLKLSPTSHFANDLGLDSLDTVEVVMAIEEVSCYGNLDSAGLGSDYGHRNSALKSQIKRQMLSTVVRPELVFTWISKF